ncbi:hypothetical protein [Neobacillus ginsengisoli]|uniref:Uncharacterized protein n=1 Tax=Neobacillus ginsengisoli TaxID=904295 RepID=A0ABT9XQ45_9BACI|nr:hypothetical protein [Neobacillus ginsengisoli]MDQ0197665.1 hypothetical protein [Neobacillus ginsengisoli]
MKTAEELIKMIKELENGERWKLLGMMYDDYYSKEETKMDSYDIEY